MIDSTTDFFTEQQQKALSITPIFSGLLSAVGSSCILFIIFRNGHRKLKRTYHRLLLGLSVFDLINSLRACTSSFVTPKGTPGMWQAHGTQGTCVAQGFFAQLAMASTLYSASLAIYFVSRITINTQASSPMWIEIFLHAIPILFATITAIAGIPLELYNPVHLGVGCWVASYPIGCVDQLDDSSETQRQQGSSEAPAVLCERGKNADVYIWIFAGFVVIGSLTTVIICMIVIYLRVRHQVRKIETRYAVVKSQNQKASASAPLRMTLEQATLYISAFLLSYSFTSALRIIENESSNSSYFIISLMSSIFYPLQGFLNFFIYARPRYMELRRLYPTLGMLQLCQKLFEPATDVYRNNNHSRCSAMVVRQSDRKTVQQSYPSISLSASMKKQVEDDAVVVTDAPDLQEI